MLVNDPSWLRYIGDRGVKTLEDARNYILRGPVDMYARLGFGLYLTELKDSGVPIGICGLIKREYIQDVEIAFAFLPKFWRKGFACESALAVMEYAKHVLNLPRIVAITSPDNDRSGRLLQKLGLKFERMIRKSDGDAEVKLFVPDDDQSKSSMCFGP